MDDLVNTMNKMEIKDQNPYLKVIPDYVLKMIHTDIEYMFMQIIHEHIDSQINTFELFKNLCMFKLDELKIIYDYITKYASNILENRFKNSGLYYNKLDLQTYIDYYTEELYEQISLMQGC
jgi:hypothetical protein